MNGQLSFLPAATSERPEALGDDEGLRVLREFISPDEERQLLDELDSAPRVWSTELKRRVQHYGFRYDYKARAISGDDYLGPLPQWANALAERLVESGLFSRKPDQVIVNEYLPGQGIALHIDRESCFGDTVASLSLGSQTMMEFRSKDRKREHQEVLEPRSLVVITGEARHRWLHGITGRATDRIGESSVPRHRRVSLTFRTVRHNPEKHTASGPVDD